MRFSLIAGVTAIAFASAAVAAPAPIAQPGLQVKRAPYGNDYGDDYGGAPPDDTSNTDESKYRRYQHAYRWYT
ncbi:hypothetical protein ABW20_dc0100458 [Dactylellina cionopaga]|nr:hypothetical protein ABW20_dc0100458 [Dactylellina cionopaga]